MVNLKYRPKLHSSVYPSLRNLIEDCWNDDPSERPTFDEIVKRLGTEVTKEVLMLREPDLTIDEDAPFDTSATCDSNAKR